MTRETKSLMKLKNISLGELSKIWRVDETRHRKKNRKLSRNLTLPEELRNR
jgi:hypothetical protein